MELARQLAEQLILLEQQAAQVAALLYDAPPELLETVGRAFAPMPDMKGANQATRDRWAQTWLDWVMESGARWESRPPDHPDGEVMAALLLRWVRRV